MLDWDDPITRSIGLSAQGLREVNGLRNSDVVFLIISTWARNGYYYRTRIIPAARTWMRLLAHVFVIIEDTVDARLAFRNCPMLEAHNLTSFHCRHEPVVILSRQCDSKYAEFAFKISSHDVEFPNSPSTANGICCKVDELIFYLTNIRTDVFRNTEYVIIGETTFLIYCIQLISNQAMMITFTA